MAKHSTICEKEIHVTSPMSALVLCLGTIYKVWSEFHQVQGELDISTEKRIKSNTEMQTSQFEILFIKRVFNINKILCIK